jgi:hypothetical protein
MARHRKADPYYKLTEEMGKGRPWHEYQEAVTRMKHGGDDMARRRRRRNPSGMSTLVKVGVGAAILYGGYQFVKSRNATPTAAAVAPTFSTAGALPSFQPGNTIGPQNGPMVALSKSEIPLPTGTGGLLL